MRLFKNLKARILKSFITWSTMGKQTAKVKEVYCDKLKIKLTFKINLSMTLEDISLKRGALSHKPVIFAASVKTYCKYI